MKKLTQASKLTKGKCFVVRLEDGTYLVKAPLTPARLCSSRNLCITGDYQSALTYARLSRLELTMQLMGCTPQNIENTKSIYEDMDFADIPQFSQMIRLVQP